MPFKELYFYNFRNLENGSIELPSGSIVLAGENGQGKTNFLEAIYMLCFGSTFRNIKNQFILKNGQREFSLIGNYLKTHSSGSNNLKIRYSYSSTSGSSIFIDERKLGSRRELLGNCSAIIFNHGDIEYVKGTPDFKRKFLDQTISLFDFEYLSNLQKYKKILQSRNLLLKQNKNESMEIYTEQLIFYGQKLVKKRKEVMDEFNKIFNHYLDGILPLPYRLKLVYKSGWLNKSDDEIKSIFREKKVQEQRKKFTVSGAHRDKYEIEYEDGDFINIASTGQLRLLSIVLKIAQSEYFRKKTGEKPVLLLDDVLLELDHKKREAVLESLPEHDQVFYTFLPSEKYTSLPKSDTLYLNVSEGKLTIKQD